MKRKTEIVRDILESVQKELQKHLISERYAPDQIKIFICYPNTAQSLVVDLSAQKEDRNGKTDGFF